MAASNNSATSAARGSGGIFGQRAAEPGTREGPITLHGLRRNIQRMGDLLDVEAPEELQLHDFGLARVELGKVFQRLVELDQIGILLRAELARFLQVHLFPFATALLPLM